MLQAAVPGREWCLEPRTPDPVWYPTFFLLCPFHCSGFLSGLWGDTKGVLLRNSIRKDPLSWVSPALRPQGGRNAAQASPASPLAPLASSVPHLLREAPQHTLTQAPQAPDTPRPSVDPTHPVPGAEVLKLSEESWEMSGTCSSWSLFHFPFQIWPGWMTGQDGREGLALPPLLKGQGDPVGWVHPGEQT